MSDYRLFTVTMDYFATGEGRTLQFIAIGANSEADARKRVQQRGLMDSYFLSGADVFDGMPPEDEPVAKFLLSRPIRTSLAMQAQKLDANAIVNLYHHMNFS